MGSEQLVGPELGRDLASNELTGVRKIRKSLTLLVTKGHLITLYTDLGLSLEDKLYEFDPSLKGVLMSYNDVAVLERAEQGRDSDYVNVTIRANFYVFYTAPGEFLSAKILQKQEDSATAIVNESFMILLNNAVAERDKVGQEITVKVKAVYYTRGVPQLVGETVPGTKRQVMMEVDRKNIKTLLDTEDDELTGLEVVEVAGKGRGVRAVRGFRRGEPVVEYVGQLANLGSARRRSGDRAREAAVLTNYTFYFHSAGYQYRIDASQETGRFGRLVNHSIVAANVDVKVVVVDNVPRLILFASRDIKTGEEILYDYGERDPEIRAANPWLYN